MERTYFCEECERDIAPSDTNIVRDPINGEDRYVCRDEDACYAAWRAERPAGSALDRYYAEKAEREAAAASGS